MLYPMCRVRGGNLRIKNCRILIYQSTERSGARLQRARRGEVAAVAGGSNGCMEEERRT